MAILYPWARANAPIPHLEPARERPWSPPLAQAS
jgi:hypothetical protein